MIDNIYVCIENIHALRCSLFTSECRLSSLFFYHLALKLNSFCSSHKFMFLLFSSSIIYLLVLLSPGASVSQKCSHTIFVMLIKLRLLPLSAPSCALHLNTTMNYISFSPGGLFAPP